jgi:hypothetical protein
MVYRNVITIIKAALIGVVLIIAGTPLLSRLGDRAAQSPLVTNGPMSMGPLDDMANLVLAIVPIGVPLGLMMLVIVATVARAALARGV